MRQASTHSHRARRRRGGAPAVAVCSALAALLLVLVAAAAAQAAAPAWKPVGVVGPTNVPPTSSEVQRVAVDAAGGSFTLTFAGQTTGTLGFDSTAGEVKAALDALSSIGGAGGSVEVEGGPGGVGAADPYFVRFAGALAATDVTQMTAASGSLTGGAATATVATDTQGGLPGTGTIVVYAFNVGGAPTSGTITATIDLPPGITRSGPPASGSGWACTDAPGGASVTCTSTDVVAPSFPANVIKIEVRTEPAAAPSSTAQLAVSGGGAAVPATRDVPIAVSAARAEAGVQEFWAGVFDENGQPETQAGAHPYTASAGFWLNTFRTPSGAIVSAGDPRDIAVDLPPGFIGNPSATPRCPQHEPLGCFNDAIVGLTTPLINGFGFDGGPYPVYSTDPGGGVAAQFTFQVHTSRIAVVGGLRSETDFGVTTTALSTPQAVRVYGAYFTVWGEPGNPRHDAQRCPGAAGRVPVLPLTCGANPGSATMPFTANPVDCAGQAAVAPTTVIWVNSWQHPDLISTMSDESPAVVGCEDVPFEPDISFETSTSASDSPSGLDVELSIPQEGLENPAVLATAHLKDTVVELPEGLSVSPSAANGLDACTPEQIGLTTPVGQADPIRFDKAAPACPNASKIGTVKIETPLLAEEDWPTGGVYVASQGRNPFGSLLALYIVAESKERGIVVKLAGEVEADAATGKLKTTFANNPQLPFSKLRLKLKSGPTGPLATPRTCGTYAGSSSFTSYADPVDPVVDQQEYVFDSGPDTGSCLAGSAASVGSGDLGARPLGLGFEAGSASRAARSSSPFVTTFTRPDGHQEVSGLTVKTPGGIAGVLKGVPKCPEAVAGSGACPAGSRIGQAIAGAGPGSSPFYVHSGEVFLSGPYDPDGPGGKDRSPLSLVVKVPAEAGPFDLGDVVVRAQIHVDPTTADLTVISDPLPQMLEGIPLRTRDIRVRIDRPGFMVAPSDCTPKTVGADIDGASGASTSVSDRYQAAGCANLPFRPKLTLALTGRRQVTTGKHPGVRAQVNQTGVGEAGIEKTVVRLPKSLALDPDNAQALCEFTDGTKPDLENHCPKGSIVGRARAVTPLLDEPLAGNVYFVKNIRIDPNTGNQIRTLPMIIVALRGEVAVNLKGESSTTKAGKLVNTFANIPDAPITQFNLNIQGGQNGILAVTRTRKALINLCTGRHTAEADIDGQNGRQHDTNIRMKTPCTKKQTKAAKRQARRAAARRAAHRR